MRNESGEPAGSPCSAQEMEQWNNGSTISLRKDVLRQVGVPQNHLYLLWPKERKGAGKPGDQGQPSGGVEGVMCVGAGWEN